MNNYNTEIPKGYMKDSQGNFVKIENIKPIDKARDTLVKHLWKKAEEVERATRELKRLAKEGIEALIQESAEKHDVKLGGRKGNVSITSYDGEMRVMRAIADSITFSEELEVARSLVNEYLNDILKGANKNLKTIVNKAFQIDNKGNVSVARILGLRQIDIQDEKWVRAMKIISESIQVQSSKEYIRFYKRKEAGDYEMVPMSIGGV